MWCWRYQPLSHKVKLVLLHSKLDSSDHSLCTPQQEAPDHQEHGPPFRCERAILDNIASVLLVESFSAMCYLSASFCRASSTCCAFRQRSALGIVTPNICTTASMHKKAVHELTCGPLFFANVVDLFHPELIKRGFWWHAAIEQKSLLHILGVNPLKLFLQHYREDFLLQSLKHAGFPKCCIFDVSSGVVRPLSCCFVANILKRSECNTCKRSKLRNSRFDSQLRNNYMP